MFPVLSYGTMLEILEIRKKGSTLEKWVNV